MKYRGLSSDLPFDVRISEQRSKFSEKSKINEEECWQGFGQLVMTYLLFIKVSYLQCHKYHSRIWRPFMVLDARLVDQNPSTFLVHQTCFSADVALRLSHAVCHCRPCGVPWRLCTCLLNTIIKCSRFPFILIALQVPLNRREHAVVP